jgi:hypothetical protein
VRHAGSGSVHIHGLIVVAQAHLKSRPSSASFPE